MAFGVADRLEPEYEAEVGLLTGPVNTDDGTVDAAGSLARTYSELASSGPLLANAAIIVGLTTSLEDLREAVTTSSNEISRIVTIRVRDTNPERASRFARVLADELIAFSQDVTVETTQAVEEFMRQQEILLLPERRQAEVREAVTRIFGTPLAGSLSVVDPPEIPEKPVAPQKRLIAALGALLGALAAATLAVFGEALRGRGRARPELQAAPVATRVKAAGPILEMGPPIGVARPGNGSTTDAPVAEPAHGADDLGAPQPREARAARARQLPAASSAASSVDGAAAHSAPDRGGREAGQNGAPRDSEPGLNGISAERVAADLQPLGHVQTRQMFGWMGIFEDGMMFALVDSGLLFFRVDDSNRVEFEAAGSSQFGKMPYFEVPRRCRGRP